MSLLAAPPRGSACASDLDLDEMLAGELTGTAKEARVQAHLATCVRCRDRLAVFTAVEPPPFSVVHARIVEKSLPLRRRRRWVAGTATFAAAAALAAGLVLVWRPAGKPTESTGERTKGSGLGLTVMVKRANGIIESVVGDGRLRAGDEMRFTLVTSRPGYAVVMGLDAAPSVTVYAPVSPSAAPVPSVGVGVGAGTTTLPGSIVADATAGTERIVAVVCPSATPPEELRRRAQAALVRAHGQPQAVASLGTGCLEASVLMRKEAR